MTPRSDFSGTGFSNKPIALVKLHNNNNKLIEHFVSVEAPTQDVHSFLAKGHIKIPSTESLTPWTPIWITSEPNIIADSNS
jgi:hypothetical protein